jgi:L-iditol 2-dehydrogenase
MVDVPKRMKALLLTGVETFELTEVDTPEPGSGEILAKVEAVAICGTDPKIVKGVFKGLWPKSYQKCFGLQWVIGWPGSLIKDAVSVEIA